MDKLDILKLQSQCIDNLHNKIIKLNETTTNINRKLKQQNMSLEHMIQLQTG